MIPSEINLTDYTKDQVEEAFEKAQEQFKKIETIDFSRMQKQIQIARECINHWQEGREQIVISAPTGFGKSILSFFITEVVRHLTQSVSNEQGTNFNRSYILTSNKFLQEQYDKDIQLFGLHHAMLKGQSNYICNVDKVNPFPKANCKDESVNSLMLTGSKGKFPCYSTCTYLRARYNAINSHSTVFNYSYFLTTMNKVYEKMPMFAPFQPRLITIFDECHILSGVVNDLFTVEFNVNQLIRRTFAISSIIRNKEEDDSFYKKYSFDGEIWKDIISLYETIRTHQDDFDIIGEYVDSLVIALLKINNEFSKYIGPKIAVDKENGEVMNDYQKDLLNYLVYLSTMYGEIRDINLTYKDLGYETSVLQFVENNFERIKTIDVIGKITDYTLKLQCTDESALIQKAALKYTKYSILMSATLGNLNDYAKKIGLTNFVTIDVESDFDYTSSPIFMVQPMVSMSYANKKQNMPTMLSRIIEIIDSNPGVRGLIHTGNFEIMNQIKNLRHPRILTYSNSSEKSELLKLILSKPDAVIAGPSLIEGIDLKDDLCRFMIYAKVPFLSLADKLTKRKMEIYKGWYDFETMKSFQQGLGRPNRHKTDWCKTYLLDESFKSFFKRYSLPMIIKNRMLDTNIKTLGMPIIDEAEIEFEKMLKEMES